jgi:hypothetical protein
VKPGRRPSAEPLVQHDRGSNPADEIDMEVAAVRHVLLTQGNMNATLLPKQFDHRFFDYGRRANHAQFAKDPRAH